MAPLPPPVRVHEIYKDWEPYSQVSTNAVVEVNGFTRDVKSSKGLFVFNTGTNTVTVTLWNGVTFPLPPLSQIDLPFEGVVTSINSTIGGAHSALLFILRW